MKQKFSFEGKKLSLIEVIERDVVEAKKVKNNHKDNLLGLQLLTYMLNRMQRLLVPYGRINRF
jgi:hypothetical protein